MERSYDPWPPEWRRARDKAREAFGSLMADLLAEGHQFELSAGAQELLLRVLTVFEKRRDPDHQFDTVCLAHGVTDRLLSAWMRACQGYEFTLSLSGEAKARLARYISFLFTETGMSVRLSEFEQSMFDVLRPPTGGDWDEEGDS